jgi:ABC-type Fe3+ transport system substrate-binding protein
VAIIRGTNRLAESQRLVDFLLSKEIELHQARSASRQIPLGPVDEAELPEDVRPLAKWAQESVLLLPYSAARTACLKWLQQEYAP